jgi:transcriptional regulator with XRE-family HTH domain
MQTKAKRTQLTELRVQAGLTLRDVARLCEVSPETVRLWESGLAIPDSLHGQRYAEVLGIPQARLNELLVEARAGRRRQEAATR